MVIFLSAEWQTFPLQISKVAHLEVHSVRRGGASLVAEEELSL